jgi:hypothetical protein
MRNLGLLSLGVLGVGVLAIPASAQKDEWERAMRFRLLVDKVARADVVVIGKVIAIEKEPVDLETVEVVGFDWPQRKTRTVSYQVALVKVQENLMGAENLTHLKIAFVPQEMVPPRPIARPFLPKDLNVVRRTTAYPVDLREGEEYLFFLLKHPEGPYYVGPYYRDLSRDPSGGLGVPIIPTKGIDKAMGIDKAIEQVKKITAILANPMAGLKSDKPEVRAQAAVVLVMKFRSRPYFAQQVDQVPIDAEMSRLILQALAEADWREQANVDFDVANAVAELELGPRDGWKHGSVVFAPPSADEPSQNSLRRALHKSFVEWLKGPGKNYRIKKFVAKN